MSEVSRKYSTGIIVCRAWKGIEMARDVVEGDATKQFSLLWRYAAELMRTNQGNTCKINVERIPPTMQPRFGSFYFCFNGTKGRVQTLILEDIGKDNRLVFISDQQKGLIVVFEELFESVEHRLCLRHLYANFKKKFGGGTAMTDLMMGAAKATYYQHWEEHMNEIKKLNVKAWEWLMGVPTKLWCKHAFSFYPKCDFLMNNLAEAFNSTILVARDKPILTMCEWIRNSHVPAGHSHGPSHVAADGVNGGDLTQEYMTTSPVVIEKLKNALQSISRVEKTVRYVAAKCKLFDN